MIFADKFVGSYLRNLATEFGSDFDDYDSEVRDSLYLHNYKEVLNKELVNRKSKQVIVTKNLINLKNVVKSPNDFILYEGIGQEVDPHNNYLFTFLRTDENSYSINSKTGQFISFGDKIKLVNAYQVYFFK